MCDQTEVEYLDQDVVWVKIGSTWWPGVVKDIEKDEENKTLILGGLKKKPIAVVKFFQEDNYEIVKNLDHIYHYNCRRKDEFIKKGLDKVRNGTPHFEKFPMDVTTAENLTNGDVNIVNDPKYYPEKRSSYSEIFGSPKKKRKKDLEISPRTSAAIGAGAIRKSTAGVTPYRPITHKRFIDKALRGESDHKVKTLIQTTSGSEDGISGSAYKCHICKFETSRVNVIVAHHRLSHSPRNSINWTGSDAKSVKRRPAYKSRKSKTKKVWDSAKEDSSEDEGEKDDDDRDAEYEEKKKSPKEKKEKVKSPEKVKGNKTPVSSGKRRGRPEGQGGSDSKKPRFTDVLLADWSEEEDDDKKNNEEDQDKDKDNDKDRDEDKKDEDEKGDKKDGKNEEEDKKTKDESSKKDGEDGEKKNEGKSDSDLSDKKSFTEKTSCFDFDDEEEGFIGMSNANTYGRKIPRVIPVKDKPELGLDLEIEELFKRKTESELNNDDVAENTERNSDEKGEDTVNADSNQTNDNDQKDKAKKTPRRRGRKKKSIPEEEMEEIKEEVKVKVSKIKEEAKASTAVKTEESLALRRTRRPGAKKSYLNEVIERIEESDSAPEEKEKEKEKDKEEEKQENGEVAGPSGLVSNPETVKVTKEENILTTTTTTLIPTFSLPPSTPSSTSSSSSSSRRKQDFKHQAIDGDRDEMVYSDILNNEQKIKTPEEKKKSRFQNKQEPGGDDLTLQIDSLLEQTKLPSLPEVTTASSEDSKSSSATSFSFDFHVPMEQAGKKVGKNKAELKSISRMFSDSIPNSETNTTIPEPLEDVQETSGLNVEDGIESAEKEIDESQGKAIKVNQASGQKRGSIVLSSMTKPTEGQVKVLPVARQTVAATKDCIVFPTAKKVGVEEVKQGSDGSSEVVALPKSIKTFKVKSDSLPSGLIAASKLKGQTIIHQKGGKYVIVTQPPQLARQRTATGKVSAGSKVVILRNQLGEQKIITTGGLQPTKFKLEGQKIVTATVAGATDSNTDIDESASTSSGTTGAAGNGNGQSQPMIKMVPDGKGGIMKHLTVSPKKVLLGGTKILVSGSGSSLSSAGSTVQKIALTTSGGVARAGGGDYRLIENYKGSGRTVIIQEGPSPSSGVVLKPSAIVPRQVTKVLQNPQGLKRKPKILMRTTGGQGEYVMQTATGTIETPTYVVKQKGPDGKFSTQKIVRTELVGQPKVSTSVGGTKAFFLAGQGPNKKGESYIITTNEAVPSKVLRMRQKVKDVGGAATGQIIGKSSELYAISPNSLLLPTTTTLAEGETSQVIQIQEQAQQPQQQQLQQQQPQQQQPQQPVLQTQVIAMPGPVGADGNQTYVLVSVDEHGVVQGMDDSVVTYDTTQSNQIFLNSTTTSTANNVILINPSVSEESTPVFSTSSQDILAEALANTNVLEGTINTEMDSVVPSILLPPSIPSSVVQETSITLQKPIMTPLEMPSSVAPDTSGLEPPPLPPTPTEEDVLMEETEMVQEPLIQESNKKEGELNEAIQTYLQPENFEGGGDETTDSFQVTDFAKENDNQKTLDEAFDSKTNKSEENVTETKTTDFYSSAMEFANENASSGHEDFKELPREDFLMDSSQEEQSTNSFQSMPLLNDEPDTSDDAQGSEPIASQQFDVQKARLESDQFSQLIREQEPPSSTNNEITSENNHESQESGFDGSKYESYHHSIYEDENCENEPKNKEPMPDDKVSEQEHNGDEIVGGGGDGVDGGVGVIGKDKEPESQSMPIIADESNVNAYEIDPIYSDVLSQKRFQEETEVSSTTDEYAGKDGGN